MVVIIDIYKFDSNYGYNRVFGFSAQDIYEGYGGGTTVVSYEAESKRHHTDTNDIVDSASVYK